MEAIVFKYLVEWGIGSVLLYSIYYFFLRKDTYFQLNRLFLLSSLIISAVIPLLNFQAISVQENSVASVMLDAINVNANGELIEIKSENFSWLAFLFKIYIAICVAQLIRFLMQFIKIISLIIKNELTKINGVNYVFTSNDFSDFSFLNFVFLKEETRDDSHFEEIIKHENIHAKQWHSLDIVITELMLVFQWFNPFLWLYQKALKQTHEYLADEGVLEQGFDLGKYQLLLVEKQIGVQPGLANNFNKSLTFKRLRMMNKMKSSKLAKFKVLAMIPVLSVLFFAFSCDKVEDVNEKTTFEFNSQSEMSPLYIVDGERVNTIDDLDPNTFESMDVIKDKDKLLEYGADGLKGVVLIKTKQASTENSIEDVTVVTNQSEDVKASQVYNIVEEMPEYPGGELALRKFIAVNVKYPAEARDKGIAGKVYVTFVVSAEGNVTDVSIARGVNKVLNDEAVRVVSMLPKWKAGKQKGKPVAVNYTMPINFAIQ